jgi:spoIIIJ-associated protein
METVERTAKTTEEAIELALKELDVDRVEVEIDIVNRGKTGILGIGGEDAKVRVTRLESPPDIVLVATEILQKLIDLLGVSVVLNLKHSELEEVGGPVFDIDGDDSGLLIGRKGETLRALQSIVTLLANLRLEERQNLLVDVSGYHERRNTSLVNLANQVARRVVSTGKSITLEPMPAVERRAVHLALSEHSNVRTFSVGSGDSRQLVVDLRSTADEEN